MTRRTGILACLFEADKNVRPPDLVMPDKNVRPVWLLFLFMPRGC
jgi:hypothetical protein